VARGSFQLGIQGTHMYVNYVTWWDTIHLYVQNFLTNQNVASAKVGTKETTMD